MRAPIVYACVKPHALFALPGAVHACVRPHALFALSGAVHACVRPHALFALSGALREARGSDAPAPEDVARHDGGVATDTGTTGGTAKTTGEYTLQHKE